MPQDKRVPSLLVSEHEKGFRAPSAYPRSLREQDLRDLPHLWAPTAPRVAAKSLIRSRHEVIAQLPQEMTSQSQHALLPVLCCQSRPRDPGGPLPSSPTALVPTDLKQAPAVLRLPNILAFLSEPPRHLQPPDSTQPPQHSLGHLYFGKQASPPKVNLMNGTFAANQFQKKNQLLLNIIVHVNKF